MSHRCRLLARTASAPRRRPCPDPDNPLSIAECRQLSPSGRASALPSADTSLAALHALPTVRGEAGLQAAALQDQVTHAVAQGALPPDQPLLIAADCHDILTYHRKKPRKVPVKPRPSKALPLAVGTKPELGTSLAYRFLTFQTTRGTPLTVHVDPFLPLENLPTKLTKGLDLTEARLGRSIDLLLYDAGAYSNEVILALQRRGTLFIIRAPQNQRIAALLRGHAGLSCFGAP